MDVEGPERPDPQHQLTVRSALDLPYSTSFDLWLRYVAELPAGNTTAVVPSYVTLDARLAWRPRPRVELSVAGQNLLESAHPEFVSDFIASQATEVPRGVYAQMQLTF